MKDGEHAFQLEISENECRKDFTKKERLEYIGMLIERKTCSLSHVTQSPSREAPKEAGISQTTYNRDKYVEAHKHVLTDEEYDIC